MSQLDPDAPRTDVQRDGDPKADRFGMILFLSGLFAAAALASLPFSVVYLASKQAAYTDVLFPLLLVAGVVALVLVVAVLVGLFKRMGLTNAAYPLGLPNGSISAIIALMLILVFAMLSVLVQVNLTPDERDRGFDAGTSRPASSLGNPVTNLCGWPVHNLAESREESSAQVDIGKQLVTTVSTLVVAISAFYFGSVQSGRAASRLGQRESDAVKS
jgi:hypothetical protein